MKSLYNGVFITDQDTRVESEGELIGYNVTQESNHVLVSEILYGRDGHDAHKIMAFDLKHKNAAIESAVLLLQILKARPPKSNV